MTFPLSWTIVPERFKPVTLPALLRQGAREFAWVNPKEEQLLGMARVKPRAEASHVTWTVEGPRCGT